MKNYLKVCSLILFLGILVYNYGYIVRNDINTFTTSNIKLNAKTNGKYIEIYENGKWEKTFLKGVNVGAAKPGYFPGEFGITKEDYLRWFKQIKEMNSNVIRVYTLQMPEFYEALFEFNRYNKEPLYLIHGVWIDEEDMLEELDAFNPDIVDNFKNEIGKVIDAIHGNGNIDKLVGRGYGKYTKDISPYIIGYILGIEWDPYFVENTNKKHEGKIDFSGKWLYTENAKPMEIFLADCGNYAIEYESTKYNTQKPIAFTNWLTTDVIDHKDEIEEANRIGNIDESNIKSKDTFKSGLFVSYHVYPYYPDFLNYEDKYTKYRDENGNKNSFKAYLEDLINYYQDMPVLVSEFGVPTSRGITHEDLSRGFNQGMIEETKQGQINSQLLQDIHSSGYAGGIVFSWQDEWFKRTWNTMDMDDSQGRAYWADKMTNEQFFGLLSFDPGDKKSVAYIDGNTKEWKNKDIISENENIKLYMKSDEAYVYFRVNKKNLDLDKEEIIIPIDITPKSGSSSINGYNVTFNEDADFIINIKGKNNSKILVNEYYDTCDFLFNKKLSKNKNSSDFSIVKQKILRQNITPETNKVINSKEVEVGNLIYGNGNPNSKNYNSLADFIINGDDIEIRIPWLMLNISNPAKKLAIDDFNKTNKINHIRIEKIQIGVYILTNNTVVDNVEMKNYTWSKWNMPTYHERLKKSYYIMKETLSKLN